MNPQEILSLSFFSIELTTFKMIIYCHLFAENSGVPMHQFHSYIRSELATFPETRGSESSWESSETRRTVETIQSQSNLGSGRTRYNLDPAQRRTTSAAWQSAETFEKSECWLRMFKNFYIFTTNSYLARENFGNISNYEKTSPIILSLRNVLLKI